MLNPDKRSFLQEGAKVSRAQKVTLNEITPLERNVEKVLNFTEPKNKKELARFLMGLARNYLSEIH